MCACSPSSSPIEVVTEPPSELPVPDGAAASHQLPVSHLVVLMCQSYIRCVHMFILHVCVSTPALELGSSVPFFWITRICVNV